MSDSAVNRNQKSDSWRVVQSQPHMADALEGIQMACFPTLAADERITAAQYLKHMEVFPEGQMAILNDEGTPVACSTDTICVMDFDHFQHRYMEASGDNWLHAHNPDGDWLYGLDMGVHPDYRGQHLSAKLYAARKDLIRRLNLKGHVVGGMLSGYGKVKDQISVKDYVAGVAAGTIFDPTVSIQLRRDFKVHGIIDYYLDDPVCDNKAALLVWHNPDYRG